MRTVMTWIEVAVRARPKTFLGVAGVVCLLDVLLPPLVLSLARKPWDFFTFNPWLSRLPEYLASGEVPLRRKLEFLPNLVLYWFSADNREGGGIDWGVAVDVTDVARFLLTSFVFGAYFALWLLLRDRGGSRRAAAGGQGGAAGVLANALGLSVAPCSVMGCGIPGLPVFGLAFAGLSSGTLQLFVQVARAATPLVLAAMLLAVGYLGWLAGARFQSQARSPGG